MKLFETMLKNACLAHETLYYHMNVIGLVSHADIILEKEKLNLLMFQGKK